MSKIRGFLYRLKHSKAALLFWTLEMYLMKAIHFRNPEYRCYIGGDFEHDWEYEGADPDVGIMHGVNICERCGLVDQDADDYEYDYYEERGE